LEFKINEILESCGFKDDEFVVKDDEFVVKRDKT
jgi:sulfur carrier protein ThiS